MSSIMSKINNDDFSLSLYSSSCLQGEPALNANAMKGQKGEPGLSGPVGLPGSSGAKGNPGPVGQNGHYHWSRK